MTDHFASLRNSLREEHLCAWEPFNGACRGKDRAEFVTRFQKFVMEPFDRSFEEAFFVRRSRDSWNIGCSLLRPLLGLLDTDEKVKMFTYLFVLHEMLHHLVQGMYSSNYQGIGRADVVLEDLDYAADAFSLLVAVEVHKQQNPATRVHDHGPLGQRYLDIAIRGMEAFDRADQGPRILILPERRLRRYLIWNIQHEVLAKSVSKEQLAALVGLRVSSQIAPLKSQMHEQKFEKAIVIYDNIKDERDAELFVSYNAGMKLFRLSASPGWSPAEGVSLIASYNWPVLRNHLERIVGEISEWITRTPSFRPT
jgi:hypothetical protein